MPNIKIIKQAKKPDVPKSSALNAVTPRFRPPGSKPPVQLDESYNKQGGKNEKQPKSNR